MLVKQTTSQSRLRRLMPLRRRSGKSALLTFIAKTPNNRFPPTLAIRTVACGIEAASFFSTASSHIPLDFLRTASIGVGVSSPLISGFAQ